MASREDIPQFRELMWPSLLAIRELGGSARIDEISEAVIESQGFTEEQQAIRRNESDHMSLIDYRLAWARNYLKNIGAIENSSRGVWSITEVGKTLEQDRIDDLVREWKRAYNREYQQRKREQQAEIETADEDDATEDEGDWTDVLVARLLEMEPEAFERLAQRLLREAGFRNVEVLGKSGDGGLDGVGAYRLSLVSFPVYFQCKRYRGTVGSAAVRDFRGAMAGRGEKGLLITTGAFTREARNEATRDGAPPVELVSGDDLCDLLREYGLGVTTRVVEAVEVDGEFFDQF